MDMRRRVLTHELKEKLESEYDALLVKMRMNYNRIMSSFPGATSRHDGIKRSIEELKKKKK